MLKLWDRADNLVQQESGMFAGKDEVRLLFPAKSIIRVSTPATGAVFQQGRDFEYLPEKSCIKRLPGSRIPCFSPADLRPDASVPCFPDPNARSVKGAVDGGFLLFDNKNFFAENQISVDYFAEYIDINPELPAQLDRLPRFRKKLLDSNSEIRITMIGDSISEGFNATSFTRGEPFAPAYIDQVVRTLIDRFRVDIKCFNRSVEGTGTRYAIENPQQWVNDQPDLLIISYGMNEFSRYTAEEFLNANLQLIDMMHQQSPDCETVLTTSMTGNPQWGPTVPGPDTAFAEAVRQYILTAADHSIALADVQKVWKMLLERKDFYDLSGNGVNHPNDYGHRVYASVLSQLLCGVNMF